MNTVVRSEERRPRSRGAVQYSRLSDGELLECGRRLSREFGEVLAEAVRRQEDDLVEAVLRLTYDGAWPGTGPTAPEEDLPLGKERR